MSLLISKNDQNILNISMIQHGVEFIGIINKKGRLVETIGKNVFCDMPKDRLEMFCMKITLRSSMQQDFDEYLEAVNYCMTQRGNSKFISIPASGGNTILAVAQRDTEPDVVVGHITQLLQRSNQYEDNISSNGEDELI